MYMVSFTNSIVWLVTASTNIVMITITDEKRNNQAYKDNCI